MITDVADMSLQTVRAEWMAPSNVVAFTTTRLGGFSKAPYNSFNLAQHVDDHRTTVDQNRQQLVSECKLPSAPIWLEQIHSTNIIHLDSVAAPLAPADGLITSSAKLVCSIMTADCMPLFLCDRTGTTIAIIHAGWRGMADGIIENAVELFNQPADQLMAWAGPTIGPQHFEIGSEVKDQLKGSDESYFRSDKPGKFFADLYALAGERLASVGVNEYSHANYCSYADSQLFYSYRRNKTTGRMASVIYLS